MLNQRRRFLVAAAASVVGIWLVAGVTQQYFESLKMTADKVRAYVQSVKFNQLTGAARAKALQDLANKLNALPFEERQRLRAEQLMNNWFTQMTEEEKTQFLEATMPTGIKQMIAAFEQLPEEKRRKTIDDAMKELRAVSNPAATGSDTNSPPPISPELEAKVRTIGLKSFYSQSSAQTKAELAPLLEALQREMESGKMMLHQQ